MKFKKMLWLVTFFFTLCTLNDHAKLSAILVEVSVGEFLDKISILKIKKREIKDPKKNKNICTELELLEKEYEKLPNEEEKMEFIEQLLSVNDTLWKLEDRIREKESEGLFDEDFIQIARNIYITNDKRYRIKQQINSFFKSQIVEEKSN